MALTNRGKIIQKGLAIIGVVALLGGCGNFSRNQEVSQDVFAMDTYMRLTAYGSKAKEAVQEGEETIYRLDRMLSTGNVHSEVGRLNRNGEGMFSKEGRELLKESRRLYKETDGLFNIAIYPMMELWGFPTKTYKVPTAQEIALAMPLLEEENIQLSKEGKVRFDKSGMKIDFGGIAKGYTSQRMMAIFRKHHVKSAMVNLGGNVEVLGTKPDGSPWKIAVENPNKKEEPLGVLEVVDKAVVTSGGYERFFTKNGQTYHHILDPRTGYPADNDLASVTVVAKNGMVADGLSTSLFIMGKETAISFWKKQLEDFDMVLYTKEGTIWVTEGLKDNFTSHQQVKVIQA